MKIHEIKCWPCFFEPAIQGQKTFEIRNNDRDYYVGDFLRVMEYKTFGEYTGREFTAKVTYIYSDNEKMQFLANTNLIVMSFKIISMSEVSANINEEALEDMIMDKSIMDLELSNN